MAATAGARDAASLRADDLTGSGRVGVGTRFSVGLIRQAQLALERLVDRHGYGRVDAVNRALVVYALIDDQLSAGRKVIIRDPNTNNDEVLLITP